MDTQAAGSPCLPPNSESKTTGKDKKDTTRAATRQIKELCQCGDVERREGNANFRTDRKLADTTTLTAALT